MGIFADKRKRKKLDAMTTSEKDAVIRRLEKEREKINSEIESILRNYYKESGNRAIKKRTRRQKSANVWDFAEE
jgi:hypothetical protein